MLRLGHAGKPRSPGLRLPIRLLRLRQSAMNIDWSSLLGAGALLAIVIPVLLTIISFVILYLVVRAAVRGGLRDHQHWLEKNRPTHAPGQHSLPVADSDHNRPM